MRSPSRRECLQVFAAAPAALGMMLGMSQGADTVRGSTRKKLMILWLSGGPSARETFNPDSGLAAEFRGPFDSPIATRTTGMRFNELWPKLADRSDKFSVLRAMDAGTADHTPGQQHAALAGNKTLCEVVGERGCTNGVPYVLLNPGSTWEGLRQAFKMSDSLAPMWDARLREFTAGRQSEDAIDRDDGGGFGFTPPRPAPQRDTMSSERQRERRNLHAAFDTNVIHAREAERMTKFQQTALDLTMGGGDFYGALRMSRADRARYGNSLAGDMVLTGKQFLQGGAGAVTVYFEPERVTFDAHSGLKDRYKNIVPPVDTAAAALIDEISSGQLEDVVLLMMGEINRTPQMNNSGGRDHWQHGNTAILAGGKIQGGVVLGRTRRDFTPIDGEVQQRVQLGNTVRIACGEDLPQSAARIREILR